MKQATMFAALHSYTPPPNWPADLFLLPEKVMGDIYQFVIEHRLHSCIELGTGFGATTCVLGAAVEELGRGRVVTVDMLLHLPVNVKVLLDHTHLDHSWVEAVVDKQGYNWYLADLIQQQTRHGVCEPLFDFCLLDGAHEWEPDALAFQLIAKLLKPGAWIALDDVNFNLRMIPNWRETHGHCSDHELDAFQIKMVYDLMVRQHPDFYNFRLTHGGRIGWAQKKASAWDGSLLSRLLSRR